MTKQWGMKNKVTPIRYVHPNSPDFKGEIYNKILDLPPYLKQHNNDIFRFVTRVLTELENIQAPTYEDLKKLPEGMKNLLSMVNLEFKRVLFHWHEVMKYVRLYEGDWIDRVTGKVTHRIFYDEREWRAATDDKNARLSFTFKDINHLIVKTENERRILGKQIIDLQEELEVVDNTQVWSRIRIGEEILRDI